MMTGTESHFRIDHYFQRKLRLGLVKGCPYIYLVSNLYRFKITLPYLVPVLLWDDIHLITKTEHFMTRSEILLQRLFIKTTFWNICFETTLHFLKSIKPNAGKRIYKQVLLIILRWMSSKKQFVIIHFL